MKQCQFQYEILLMIIDSEKTSLWHDHFDFADVAHIEDWGNRGCVDWAASTFRTIRPFLWVYVEGVPSTTRQGWEGTRVQGFWKGECRRGNLTSFKSRSLQRFGVRNWNVVHLPMMLDDSFHSDYLRISPLGWNRPDGSTEKGEYYSTALAWCHEGVSAPPLNFRSPPP